jgi:hypothetical protein
VRDDVPIDSDVLLVTDFVNLKIKPTQSFRNTHRNMMCVHVLIENTHTYINIYVYTIFLKKILANRSAREKSQDSRSGQRSTQ